MLEVQPVLFLAIIGEEVLVLAVGVEGPAVFFDGEFVFYGEVAATRLAPTGFLVLLVTS